MSTQNIITENFTAPITRIPKIRNVPITNQVTTNDISSCHIGYSTLVSLNVCLKAGKFYRKLLRASKQNYLPIQMFCCVFHFVLIWARIVAMFTEIILTGYIVHVDGSVVTSTMFGTVFKEIGFYHQFHKIYEEMTGRNHS